MNFLMIFPYYFSWHYTRAIKNLVSLWFNFSWFLYNFFSIRLLFINLFRPYKKNERKEIIFDKFFSQLFLDISLRIIGFLLRLCVIAFGIFCIILLFFVGLFFVAFWLILPFISILLFIAGLWGLIKTT
jgi:hypothetical protein